MTNDDDIWIRAMARGICAAQAEKQDNYDWKAYLSGERDHTVWMRLVEEGIRKGIELATAQELST